MKKMQQVFVLLIIVLLFLIDATVFPNVMGPVVRARNKVIKRTNHIPAYPGGLEKCIYKNLNQFKHA